ncbi:hypothetical protein [Sideroxydans sp. CL21]|uniref:hypothetical protein n=1 Tax=Sideroxydans sp. CL21 TaxID=2600596 RepID=UPI0024BC9082|nr:hypothetical protein [Sideroxydans sp. CL21]
MSNDKSIKPQLGAFIADLEKHPNIWGTASVEAEPQKWLEAWQVFKVVKTNGFEDRFGLHFVGRNSIEVNGAVSSKIESFDPVTMRGITSSGRIYQLVGPLGFCDDAQYVLGNWCRFNRVEVEDATEEFIQRFSISLENIKKVTG